MPIINLRISNYATHASFRSALARQRLHSLSVIVVVEVENSFFITHGNACTGFTREGAVGIEPEAFGTHRAAHELAQLLLGAGCTFEYREHEMNLLETRVVVEMSCDARRRRGVGGHLETGHTVGAQAVGYSWSGA